MLPARPCARLIATHSPVKPVLPPGQQVRLQRSQPNQNPPGPDPSPAALKLASIASGGTSAASPPHKFACAPRISTPQTLLLDPRAGVQLPAPDASPCLPLLATTLSSLLSTIRSSRRS